MITLKDVSKKYGNIEVLHKINLNIPNNKIIGLLGANGSGKTTIIKLINGLLQPSEGEISIDGKKVGVESKKVISYLPENNCLDLNMKITEIMNLFSDFYEDFDDRTANKLFDDFKIDVNSKLKNMSKGTKEKIQLVLVISRKADIYILDEPISGVDPATRDNILDTILNNFNENATLLISTHLISDVERILDEVIFVNNGKIMLHENADKLRTEKNKSIDQIFREVFKC